MKTLFADIYNKILELFQIERSENTGTCAANRLQVILMHDRTKLDPLIMNKMREELEIGLKQEGDAAALMLNIPIVRAKTEEELAALRKKLQEDEEKVSDDDSDEENEKEPEILDGEVTEVIEETRITLPSDEDDLIVEEEDIKE